MRNVRVGRISEQLKKEISQLLQFELKDPRIGFVSITDVEVTGDLQQATVFVSIFGEEEKERETLAALERAKGFIRSELGKRVKLRHTPEIFFQLDTSLAYGSRISSLLSEIQRKGE